MVDYSEIRRRDDEIRDKHYQEMRRLNEEREKDLKCKLRRIYIGGFVIFALMCLLYSLL